MGLLMHLFEFNILTYLLEVSVQSDGIRFLFLKRYTWYFISIFNIESVSRMSSISFRRINAFSLETRWLFGQTYVIFLKKGWFTRKILITPKDVFEFDEWVIKNNLAPKKKDI